MDNIDINILNELKENSRVQISEISKKVNLSIPAVSERMRKLEDADIIEKYTVRINREKMDYNLLALIFVNIDKTEYIDNFRSAITKFDSVLECHHLAGEYDYFLKVIAKNTKDLEYFITNKLKKLKGIEKTNTIIVLSSIKEEINM